MPAYADAFVSRLRPLRDHTVLNFLRWNCVKTRDGTCRKNSTRNPVMELASSGLGVRRLAARQCGKDLGHQRLRRFGAEFHGDALAAAVGPAREGALQPMA